MRYVSPRHPRAFAAGETHRHNFRQGHPRANAVGGKAINSLVAAIRQDQPTVAAKEADALANLIQHASIVGDLRFGGRLDRPSARLHASATAGRAGFSDHNASGHLKSICEGSFLARDVMTIRRAATSPSGRFVLKSALKLQLETPCANRRPVLSPYNSPLAGRLAALIDVRRRMPAFGRGDSEMGHVRYDVGSTERTKNANYSLVRSIRFQSAFNVMQSNCTNRFNQNLNDEIGDVCPVTGRANSCAVTAIRIADLIVNQFLDGPWRLLVVENCGGARL